MNVTPHVTYGVTNVTVSAWVSAVIRVACCTWVSRTWPMASQTSSVLNLRVAPGCVAGEVGTLALLIVKRKAYNVTCTQPLNNCHSTLVYFLFFYLPESLFVWHNIYTIMSQQLLILQHIKANKHMQSCII